jgi:hypothetical protein
MDGVFPLRLFFASFFRIVQTRKELIALRGAAFRIARG